MQKDPTDNGDHDADNHIDILVGMKIRLRRRMPKEKDCGRGGYEQKAP